MNDKQSPQGGSQEARPHVATPAAAPWDLSPASVAPPRPWKVVQVDAILHFVADANGLPIVQIKDEGDFMLPNLATAKMIVVAVNACFGGHSQTSGEGEIEAQTRWGLVEAAAPQFTIHEADGDRVVDPRRIGA